jgi:hypothetical protein
MAAAVVSVVSIHDSKTAYLACDLKDVLAVLGGYLGKWAWCVTDLDAFGEGAAGRVVEELCRQVERAKPLGVWLSSDELVSLAAQTAQTIDGTFVAFPSAVKRENISETQLSIAAFPESAAELVVLVVDSSCLEVCAKDSTIPAHLRRHFQDVREEDPQLYFPGA